MVFMVCFFYMTIINSREDILKHETPEYIASRPMWALGKGRIPALSDYRKLSVDNMEEAMTLAKIGQIIGQQFIPSIQEKPFKTYFTQALILGASLITRSMAEKYHLDFEKYRSVLLVCPSRYGKSFINAASILIHAGANGEEVQIGAATMPKAQIIQAKAVEMLPWTNIKIQEGLIVDGDKEEDRFKKIKRLTTQVSKDNLRWTNGGSIAMFSTNETKKNAEVAAAGAIGIGGDFAVFDEVQLMTPVGFRTASRFMVESPDTKRFCVGNPMINGHFKELYDDPDTFVVHINEVTAIIEERMSRKGIRLTGMPTYSEQYRAFVETEFPDERSGTRFFTTLPEMWDPAKLPQPVRKFYFMGIDSAYKGGDSLMMSIVSFNEGGGKKWFALERQEDLKQRFGGKWEANTTLDISLDILKTWEKYNVTAGAIDIGFGIHIYEKLRDLDPEIPLEPINYASKPTEWRIEQDYNAKFALNKRAELHLDLRDLSSNDLLYIAPDYYDEVRREMGEVAQAPAKQKIQIEPKKDIKLRLGRSPDAMDSLCLGIHAAVLSGVLNGTNQLTDEDMMEIL